jgi:hypothetical protein
MLSLDGCQKWRMASRQTYSTDVVRMAAFVLSIALIVWITFSVW